MTFYDQMLKSNPIPWPYEVDYHKQTPEEMIAIENKGDPHGAIS